MALGGRCNDPANQTVAIIGAGLIGRSWAMVFARAGWHVLRLGSEPRPSATAAHALHRPLAGRAAGARAGAGSAAAAARVQVDRHGSKTRSQAADCVQESGPEVLEIKRETFRRARRASRRRTAVLA